MTYELFPADHPFDDVIDRLEQHDQDRQKAGARAAQALRLSKKSIFALQRRNDAAGAAELLGEAAAILVELQEEHGDSRLRVTTGQWRVALEEFLEAVYFLRFWEGKPVNGLRDDYLGYEVDGEQRWLLCSDVAVFGALSDLTGEIARQMSLWIADGKYQDAVRACKAVACAAEVLNQNNSGGELRRKVEQANSNLQRADARLSDMKIRGLI